MPTPCPLACPANQPSRCVVIPAIKKNAVIPDQLIKRLAGETLIQRAITTAKGVVAPEHVWVITDSDEIRLICERAGVRTMHDPNLRIASLNIVQALREKLQTLADLYQHIIIYRASSPLITPQDIEDAYGRFTAAGADCLVTLKSVAYRMWQGSESDLSSLLFQDEGDHAYIETKALFMLQANALSHIAPQGKNTPPLKIIPYFLNDRSIEINSYQDWWICEKILQSKHIVFVVAGYAAIGMGHIYRALMLAHEIADHRVTFLCTKESELAASNIAARDYRTRIQQHEDLAQDVLALRPHLVVNDILDTEAAYIQQLKNAGIPVVNFEDEGPGAACADLVVNALYEAPAEEDPRVLYGYTNFCLRDEFVYATRNTFRPSPKRLLITFGGTDHSDYTRQTLDAVLETCNAQGLEIVVVTGPGYAHKENLTAHVERLNSQGQAPPIVFTHATNVMSRMMENTDIAISSAGRTVYELAHMRIPAIVISHHEREDMHTFARPANGFLYLGIMEHYNAPAMQKALHRLCTTNERHELFQRMSRFDFTRNKTRVVHAITSLLGNGSIGE
ncbi:cytidylyltransferase domain-containing protein [Desulfovibrio cuneatus]|uniref:cytidylyltransferase domain-containing protein n=1 Tax=Desulfovibrio cuneatus TaxID=159728 RepID=UPI0003FF9208|nr:glycosyltransferase [Desulfovibrio cuneatus]